MSDMRAALIRRITEERGISLIEVMVAVLVLTVGILALVSSFDDAQKLTLTAERRSALTHRAQRQIEQLETVAYEDLAMSAAPTHSTEANNPDRYVDYNNPVTCKEAAAGSGCFAYNANATATEAPLAIAGSGSVSPTPESWTTGNVSGKTYAFITWAKDPLCESKPTETCPAENDYKRITVAATATLSGGHTMKPVWVSVLMPDPNVAGENPLDSPGTTCGNEEKCTSGITSGTVKPYVLLDSPAHLSDISEPSASHATHTTVAPAKLTACTNTEHSGCPQPDLMHEGNPDAEYLYDYSTDQDGSGATITPATGVACPGETRSGLCYGGRALQRGPECDSEPSATEAEANFKSEMWVSPPLEAATKLTGSGGLSIHTQTLGGVPAAVTLCVALYTVPENIEDLWAEAKTTPQRIGWTSYTPPSGLWPSSLEQISFDFEPASTRKLTEPNGSVVGATGTPAVNLTAGERIGLRIWPALSSEHAISIAYGTGGHQVTENGQEHGVDEYASQFLLNVE